MRNRLFSEQGYGETWRVRGAAILGKESRECLLIDMRVEKKPKNREKILQRTVFYVNRLARTLRSEGA